MQNIEILNHTKGLTVMADSMLGQLFYNLLDSSVKHGRKVTKITLTNEQVDGETKITYTDDGSSVLPENKMRIFSGFTTGGSGLGLMLIKKMIQAYGWTIKENGVRGFGVRFEISIKTGKVTGCQKAAMPKQLK